MLHRNLQEHPTKYSTYTADQRAKLLTLFWHGRVLFAATLSKASVAEDYEELPWLLFSLSLSLALLSNLQHSSHRNSDLNNSISFLGIHFRLSFSPNYFLLTVTHSFGTYTSSSFLVSKRFAASLSFIIPFYWLMDQKYLDEVLVRYALQLSVFVKTECLECVDWLTLLRFSIWTGACSLYLFCFGLWSFGSVSLIFYFYWG